MDTKKSLGVIGTVIAVIVAVIGVSVVWAAYTSTLTVKGSASAEGSNWSIIFKGVPGEDGTESIVEDKGNAANLTTTLTSSKPSIDGDTTLGDYVVGLKTPGDWVSYTFIIRNDGDFPATIDSGWKVPTPTCGDGTDTAGTDANKVCTNLKYTLNYVSDDGTVGDPVKAGDSFAANTGKKVVLKLLYNPAEDDDKTGATLPATTVNIGNLGFTIPFTQA